MDKFKRRIEYMDGASIIPLQPNEYEKLIKLAYYDNLTGVYNRNYLNEINFEEYQYLYFIDVNKLKEVNSKFGHIIGDRYLLQVVEDLQQKFNKSTKDFRYTIIRYGGDEFLVLTNQLFFLQNTNLYTFGHVQIKDYTFIEFAIQDASLAMLRNKP